MSPLEAMARALQRQDYKRAGWAWSDDEFDGLPQDTQDVLLGDARAALTALRDAGVTEGMVKAASAPYRRMSKFASIKEVEADRWRAMLDAALEEG